MTTGILFLFGFLGLMAVILIVVLVNYASWHLLNRRYNLRAWAKPNQTIRQYLRLFKLDDSDFRRAYRSSANEWLLFTGDGVISNSCVDLGYFIFIPYKSIELVIFHPHKKLLCQPYFSLSLQTEFNNNIKIVHRSTGLPPPSPDLTEIKQRAVTRHGLMIFHFVSPEKAKEMKSIFYK